MMNVFALGLLFTSLVTAGFFSPAPGKQNSKENIVLKDGNRVVVEFEKDNGNTKVSISPQDNKGSVENVEEKMSEKLESELKEEDSAIPEEIHRGFSPRELVCDAYGKCKYKIAAAIGKTKEAVAEKAHEVEEEAGESVGKVKDTATHSAHRVSDKARESTENLKESAREAKDKVSDEASEIKEGAAVQAEKAKSLVSEKAKEGEEMVEDASDRLKQGAQKVKAFLVPPVIMNSVFGVLHLLGFAAAYGMCVWVTFASSYVLAAALPRQQFGMVQSKIYPVYFKAMAYCVGMALFGHLLSQRKRLSTVGVGMFQACNLVVSLVMVLANLLYLEPRATKVMFERMKKEKEEGRGKESDEKEPSGRNIDPTTDALAPIGVTGTGGSRGSVEEKQTDTAAKAEMVRMSEMLRRLNSYSSFLNVVALVSLTCHLVYLGQRLHFEC